MADSSSVLAAVRLVHLIHPDDGLVDLVDTGRLLLDSRPSISDTMTATRFAKATISSSCAPDCPTSADPSWTFWIESWIRPRISRAALALPLGQAADFRGNDGKAPPVVAGPRRFHGGIQGEQVRLERDLVDEP